MILFMVIKTQQNPPPDTYLIPKIYSQRVDLTQYNVRFISWNETVYKLASGEELRIQNVTGLKQAVFDVAQSDPVCKGMKEQFQIQYGIDIFELWSDTGNEGYHIIGDVFSKWAHPMIGNVLVSAGIRPQTSESQYVKNWDSFPKSKMTATTKAKIKAMIDESMALDPASGAVSAAGLGRLTHSSRDQVRMCKDMTELARAVIGEITTYATKKLEKIYALELCNSAYFLEAQKHFLNMIVYAHSNSKDQYNLENLFKNVRGPDGSIRNSIQLTEYIYFYFPQLATLCKDNQWVAFAKLINICIDEYYWIIYREPADLAAKAIIDESVNNFMKFPPIIRGAMIINAIRKFDRPPNSKRYAAQIKDATGVHWEIEEAPGPKFIPELSIASGTGGRHVSTKNVCLWNWTRDEKHPATSSYRQWLMPLWGGPSGHAAGLIDFYTIYLGTDIIEVSGRGMPIGLIILPTMFAFWRLYYDKRICAVHTMAETFDAGLTHALADGIIVKGKTSFNERRGYVRSQINAEAATAQLSEFLKYDEIFETITHLPDLSGDIFNDTGVLHPVRIMAQIKNKYYVAPKEGEKAIDSIDALKGIIDSLRASLTAKGYEVPRWACPINGIDSAPTIAESRSNNVFRGMVIRSYQNLNVQVFIPKDRLRRMAASLYLNLPAMPSVKLSSLYEKIRSYSESKEVYCFADDFPDLPMYFTETQRAPFLSVVSFSDIRECILGEKEFTYRSTVGTDADFWKSVREVVSVADEEEILCTVTETEDGLHFVGEIRIESEYKVTDEFKLNMRGVTIESGLDDRFCLPGVRIASEVTDGKNQFDLTVVLSPGSDRLCISGEYEDGKVLTISGLLSLFGLDGIVPAKDLLPDQETVFGALGLRAVSLTLNTNPVSILNVGFTITSEKSWSIFEDKISLQPYFEITVEYPLDSTKRKVDYTVLGRWNIGSTVFDLMYRSDKTVYACLAEDSVLNFSDITELFAKDVSFPPVELTDVEISADVASGNYSLYLAADHVLEFSVGKAKIGIEDISFALDFVDGKFGDLSLGGTISLAGITLTLNGTYGTDRGLVFDASAYSEQDYSLGDFAAQIAKDFGQTFDRESLPESLLSVNIRMITVSYQSVDKVFNAYIDLENVLVVSDDFSISEIAFSLSSSRDKSVEFQVIARIRLGGAEIILSVSKEKDGFIMSGEADLENFTFGSIADEFGVGTDHLPGFITEFAVMKLGVKYNFTSKNFALNITTTAGKIAAEIKSGNQSGWSIIYETDSKFSVDLLNMPLAGELVRKIAPETSDLSVKDFMIEASSEEGVLFRCMAFGSVCEVNLYKLVESREYIEDSASVKVCAITKLSKSSEVCETDGLYKISTIQPDRFTTDSGKTNGSKTAPDTIKWINLNKTFAVLTIAKAGIGLDGSRVVLLLDASLAVAPFTFSLAKAGVGINLSRLSDISFYLSGFGVVFDNGIVAVSGSFYKAASGEKEVYAGSLLIKFKAVSVTAVGEYSSGSLMAYMAVSASIGGPPAFFVTGLALGFGYNKRLTLPPVEKVPNYPLIKAAREGFNARTLAELNEWITDESRQNFLTAGVKFTSFKIVDGFLLLSVSFGKQFEIGVLGIADISMPPNASSNPVAKAQLALKADYNPTAGVFSVEARLTSESYILSRDCKLTGGFAAYFWFGSNEHSGDFVITLGGYHPAFNKPAHYPQVPRLGLNWNINSNLNITGEIYFALTPSTVMAGGKLSAVYTQGKLKAWFIAYADFIVSWKPFSYRARIGVSLGASYRVDIWFVHKTFSIELAAQLDLWGPEVQGRLHVSWFIISFTISFSKGTDHSKDALDWNTFKESFLSDKAGNNRMAVKAKSSRMASRGNTDILAVTTTGVVGTTADGTEIIDPGAFEITLTSKIPESGNVRPVNSAKLQSKITLTVTDRSGRSIDGKFKSNAVVQNIPAALWKSAPDQNNRLREESVVRNAVCGVSYTLNADIREAELFPKTRFISLEELYRNNMLTYEDCFRFIPEQRVSLSDEDSIRRFSQDADSEKRIKLRQQYLAEHGITEPVRISRFVKEAENWLAEELLISS